MTMYVGPERRRKVRRTYEHLPNRRSGSDRRQQALSGVVSGMSAEQMELLTRLWRMIEKDDERRGIMK